MPLRRLVALFALAIWSCFCFRQADAFFAPSNIIVGARARGYGVSGGGFWQLYAGSSFWKQRPGETDKDFFKRISQAASSPESFESASLGKEEKKKEVSSASTMKNATTDDAETPKKKS
jgi:hypothetical protein